MCVNFLLNNKYKITNKLHKHKNILHCLIEIISSLDSQIP